MQVVFLYDDAEGHLLMTFRTQKVYL